MNRLLKWNTLIHHLVIYCVLSIIIRNFLVFEIRKNLDLRKFLVTPRIFLKSKFHCTIRPSRFSDFPTTLIVIRTFGPKWFCNCDSYFIHTIWRILSWTESLENHLSNHHSLIKRIEFYLIEPRQFETDSNILHFLR